MTDKQIILNGVDVLKEKINICFILLLNKLETSETIEQTIYEHLDVFVEEWNKQLKAKEQECEELKKKCNIYTCGICGNKEDCNKLYKTLTEIKEIVEKRNYLDYNECLDDILQKISECEVGNEN